MANPNLIAATGAALNILAEAQLSSGDNDFVVPSGTAWILRSFIITNVSANSVTLSVLVIKSGGTARAILSSQPITAGDGYIIGTDMLGGLPEGATLRLNASAGSALDVLITGLVST